MKRKRVYLYIHPEDEMKDLTVCRNCGKPVEYGKLVNNTGHDACPDCYESLRKHIMETKEQHYEQYVDMDHFYLLPNKEYQEICERLLGEQIELMNRHLYVTVSLSFGQSELIEQKKRSWIKRLFKLKNNNTTKGL